MKKLILVICALSSFGAVADDKCQNVADMAEVVMKAHQAGMAMGKAMEILNAGELGTVMIKDAYAKPRFRGADSKLDSVGRFRDEWHLACLNIE